MTSKLELSYTILTCVNIYQWGVGVEVGQANQNFFLS